MTYGNKGYCREKEGLEPLPELSLNLLAPPCFPSILIHMWAHFLMLLTEDVHFKKDQINFLFFFGSYN